MRLGSAYLDTMLKKACRLANKAVRGPHRESVMSIQVLGKPEEIPCRTMGIIRIKAVSIIMIVHLGVPRVISDMVSVSVASLR